jgi:hypothetical protein
MWKEAAPLVEERRAVAYPTIVSSATVAYTDRRPATQRERIFIEAMTSDRKLKTFRKGTK